MNNSYNYIELLKKMIKRKERKIEELQEQLAELKEELREKENYQALEEMEVEY